MSLIMISCCCSTDIANCWYGGEAKIGTPNYTIDVKFVGFAQGPPTTEAWCQSQGHPPCDYDGWVTQPPCVGPYHYNARTFISECECRGNKDGQTQKCEATTYKSFSITQPGCTPISGCDENDSYSAARGNSDCIQYMPLTYDGTLFSQHRDILLDGTKVRTQQSTTWMNWIGPKNNTNYTFNYIGTPCCDSIQVDCHIVNYPDCPYLVFDGCTTIPDALCFHPSRCIGDSVNTSIVNTPDCPQGLTPYENPDQSGGTQTGGLIFRPTNLPCNSANLVRHGLYATELYYDIDTILNPDGSVPAGALWVDCLKLTRTNAAALAERVGIFNELEWQISGLSPRDWPTPPDPFSNWSPCNAPDFVGLDRLDAINNVAPFGTLPESCHSACSFAWFTLEKNAASGVKTFVGRGFLSSFLSKINPWLTINAGPGYSFSSVGDISDVYAGGTIVNGSNSSAYDLYWKAKDTAGGATAAGAMNGCHRQVDESGKEVPLESRIRCAKEIYRFRTIVPNIVLASSAEDIGDVTKIVSMGTTTATQWRAMGWQNYAGFITPMVGTYFVKTATGGGTGTTQSKNWIKIQTRPKYFVFGTGIYNAKCHCTKFAASNKLQLSQYAGTCDQCAAAYRSCPGYPPYDCHPPEVERYCNIPWTGDTSISYDFDAAYTFGGTQTCASCQCTCPRDNAEFIAEWKTPYSVLRGNGFSFAALHVNVVVALPSSQNKGMLISHNLGCPSTLEICDPACCRGIGVFYS